MAHLLVGESLPQAQGHLEAVPDFAWIQFGSSRANGLSG